eukprot:CAMPEP_0197590516 /NCGR_PEP_ID=MMETSP1326-20131121/11416_1 /TAXON_ID=1155430 /ORGANISM="Genus nov. species nov., Strain RCC2288" /LENGTH=37 /DNA_ID= /DNA_START= /DNA_END= /DNA_ORIENTATION=
MARTARILPKVCALIYSELAPVASSWPTMPAMAIIAM